MAIREAEAAAAISTTTVCSTATIVFLILIFSLCRNEASSTSDFTSESEKECSYTITSGKGLFTSRKILMGLMGRDKHNDQVAVNEKAEFSSSSSRGTSTRNINDDDELRNVPSGPDPMHHNGGSPKRPQAP